MKNIVVDFLEEIRLTELDQVETLLKKAVPSGAVILEVGAGTGWQARALAARGYAVSAIDIPSSNHGQARIWPIIDFNGQSIPFPDQSFDVVYSSNVLEHVEDFPALNNEIARVMRNGGIAIHFVPTSAWRAWSLAAFYPALLLDVFHRLKRNLFVGCMRAVPSAPSGTGSQRSLLAKILYRIVPHPHGSVGTCLTELSRFSRHSWDTMFLASGWSVDSYSLNKMFLTGDMILGSLINTKRRRRLSSLLGSTAHLYVLKRKTSGG